MPCSSPRCWHQTGVDLVHGERRHLMGIQVRYYIIEKEHNLDNTNVFDVNIKKAFKHLFHHQR